MGKKIAQNSIHTAVFLEEPLTCVGLVSVVEGDLQVVDVALQLLLDPERFLRSVL
jgi:hypothetical protein